MSGETGGIRELLDRVARAIGETHEHLDRKPLADVLSQLEDIQARLLAHEPLAASYLQSISFHVIATRDLDDSDDTHGPYLGLLSELAARLKNHSWTS